MKASDIVEAISDNRNVTKELLLAEKWGNAQKIMLVAALLEKAVYEVSDLRHNSPEEAAKLMQQIQSSAQNIKKLTALLPVLQSELRKEHFTQGSCDPLGKEAVRASSRLLSAATGFVAKTFSAQPSGSVSAQKS